LGGKENPYSPALSQALQGGKNEEEFLIHPLRLKSTILEDYRKKKGLRFTVTPS
jgi:hypothetical protein